MIASRHWNRKFVIWGFVGNGRIGMSSIGALVSLTVMVGAGCFLMVSCCVVPPEFMVEGFMKKMDEFRNGTESDRHIAVCAVQGYAMSGYFIVW